MLWHNYYFQHFTKSDKESMQNFFFHFTKTLTHLTTNILLYKILRRPNVWGDLKWPHWGQCKIKLHCNEAISQFYCCRRSMLIFPVKNQGIRESQLFDPKRKCMWLWKIRTRKLKFGIERKILFVTTDGGSWHKNILTLGCVPSSKELQDSFYSHSQFLETYSVLGHFNPLFLPARQKIKSAVCTMLDGAWWCYG